MGLIVSPLAADKVAAWTAFVEEATVARREEFDDFNRRHGITRHETWLAETHAGAFVVAIHEGPGAEGLMAEVTQSAHPFDRWFAAKLAEVYGRDVSKPPPGAKKPERKVSWRA
jgi:hypothetical protein